MCPSSLWALEPDGEPAECLAAAAAALVVAAAGGAAGGQRVDGQHGARGATGLQIGEMQGWGRHFEKVSKDTDTVLTE